MTKIIFSLLLITLLSIPHESFAMGAEEKVAAGASVGVIAGVFTELGGFAFAVINENSDKKFLGIYKKNYALPVMALGIAAPFVGAELAKRNFSGTEGINTVYAGGGAILGTALLSIPAYSSKSNYQGTLLILSIIGGSYLGGLAGANDFRIPIFATRF